MTDIWVVGLVGCIECGVPSGIYGVFTDEKVAKAHYENLNENYGTWDIHGGDGFWFLEHQILDKVCLDHEYITKGYFGDEEE